jgi:uncharacterized protein (UPF0335 family)
MATTKHQGNMSEIPLDAGERLSSFILRIENLEEERATVKHDIDQIYAELKASGFSDKVTRKLVALRSKEPNTVKDEEELLRLYKAALGMD